jgi:hypothetical protein
MPRRIHSREADFFSLRHSREREGSGDAGGITVLSGNPAPPPNFRRTQ